MTAEAWWFASSFRERGKGLIKRGGSGGRKRARHHFEPSLINEGNFFSLRNGTEFLVQKKKRNRV